jgi:hypothetical protein
LHNPNKAKTTFKLVQTINTQTNVTSHWNRGLISKAFLLLINDAKKLAKISRIKRYLKPEKTIIAANAGLLPRF